MRADASAPKRASLCPRACRHVKPTPLAWLRGTARFSQSRRKSACTCQARKSGTCWTRTANAASASAIRSGIVGQREERPAVSTRGFVSPLLSRASLLRPHEQRLALFARARSVREKKSVALSGGGNDAYLAEPGNGTRGRDLRCIRCGLRAVGTGRRAARSGGAAPDAGGARADRGLHRRRRHRRQSQQLDGRSRRRPAGGHVPAFRGRDRAQPQRQRRAARLAMVTPGATETSRTCSISRAWISPSRMPTCSSTSGRSRRSPTSRGA